MAGPLSLPARLRTRSGLLTSRLGASGFVCLPPTVRHCGGRGGPCSGPRASSPAAPWAATRSILPPTRHLQRGPRAPLGWVAVLRSMFRLRGAHRLTRPTAVRIRSGRASLSATLWGAINLPAIRAAHADRAASLPPSPRRFRVRTRGAVRWDRRSSTE